MKKNMILLIFLDCIASGLLFGCSRFESKLLSYIGAEKHSCKDTTYWQVVDLKEVLNIDYDRLYIISEFADAESIAKITSSNWNATCKADDDRDLLILVKGQDVVYHELISKWEDESFAFDKQFDYQTLYSVLDSTSLYYVRIDITKGNAHYFLYNKERMDEAQEYRQFWSWFRKSNNKIIAPKPF